ncbi:hypothetical protein MIC97_12240 [Aquamicrobium sp. NLF2-7]|uniref:hypothetical protein n=1 Tax=Aquamicrobium sp. NLF2-7 TaxID=2918753 RepID=UPI001EFBC234|nr:hypothetical protein [Aquamicrobium sp. NLF2-7]MCG8272271.1 hypothetical protein [Aquamicrobium sp. NLF2-7]
MSEQAIKFLQEWIGENCQSPSVPVGTDPVKIDEQAETLARECTEEAAQAGIPLEDIQEEVGDIQELIALHLEDAAETDAENGEAGQDGQSAPPAAADGSH